MQDRQLNSLPVAQIHQFWRDVEESLSLDHRLTGDQSVRAILRYRNEIEGTGTMVYHRDARDIADDIVSGEYVAADREAG